MFCNVIFGLFNVLEKCTIFQNVTGYVVNLGVSFGKNFANNTFSRLYDQEFVCSRCFASKFVGHDAVELSSRPLLNSRVGLYPLAHQLRAKPVRTGCYYTHMRSLVIHEVWFGPHMNYSPAPYQSLQFFSPSNCEQRFIPGPGRLFRRTLRRCAGSGWTLGLQWLLWRPTKYVLCVGRGPWP